MVAAIRRGCVQPIWARWPRPIAFGSCVVFPEPVSPATITTWCAAIAAAISATHAEIGSSGGARPPLRLVATNLIIGEDVVQLTYVPA